MERAGMAGTGWGARAGQGRWAGDVRVVLSTRGVFLTCRKWKLLCCQIKVARLSIEAREQPLFLAGVVNLPVNCRLVCLC